VNNTVHDANLQVSRVYDRQARDNIRHVSEGAAGDVGEYLLHDGVVAVLSLGLDQLYLELSRQLVL
jgi:hypothetical protein